MVQQHPYHLGTYRSADSQIHRRPTESKPFNKVRQVISSGLDIFYPSKYYRSEVFRRSSEKLTPQLICFLLILQLIPEMSGNSLLPTLPPAEFSSRSLFLILVLGEPYLPRGLLYFGSSGRTQEPASRTRPASLQPLTPCQSRPRSPFTPFVCSSDLFICSQLESQGTFQKQMS